MFHISKFIEEAVTQRNGSMFREDLTANWEHLSKEINGKRVLVIGGAGTIGSSYIRALLPFRPASLVVVDLSENGLTIYKAASLAGVNRTTLQKVLSDERNASEELIQKLLSVLKLSPAEKAELKELFAIQLMGEDIYLQRQYIKK